MASQLTILQKLNPETEIVHNGVVLKVRGLRNGRAVDILKFVASVGTQLQTLDFSELDEKSMPLVFSVLNECISIPADPSVKVEDLPFYLMPDLLEAVIDLSFSMGKWQAQGEKYGLLAPKGSKGQKQTS